MKKFIIARALFLGIISSWGTQSAAGAIGLFQITMDSTFPAPVIYSANVNSDCTFNKSKPIAVSWGQGKVSLMQKLGLGGIMGPQISYQDSQKVVFDVKTMIQNKISWSLTAIVGTQNGQCAAQVLAPDNGQAIQNINVLALSGYTPTEVMVDPGSANQRDVCFSNCGDTQVALKQ